MLCNLIWEVMIHKFNVDVRTKEATKNISFHLTIRMPL